MAIIPTRVRAPANLSPLELAFQLTHGGSNFVGTTLNRDGNLSRTAVGTSLLMRHIFSRRLSRAFSMLTVVVLTAAINRITPATMVVFVFVQVISFNAPLVRVRVEAG